MPYSDPQKQRAAQAEWYRQNKDLTLQRHQRNKANNPSVYKKLNDQSRARMRRIREATVGEFYAKGCRICGESDRAALAAHHLDPAKKEHQVSTLVQKFSLAKVGRLVRELKKCICLCHNCHAKYHAGGFCLLNDRAAAVAAEYAPMSDAQQGMFNE